MKSREQLVQHLRTFLGVKFQHQGRSRHGMDCVGLPLEGCKFLGVPVEDVKAYGREGLPGQLSAIISKYGVRVPVSDRRPGNIGVFWFDRYSKADQHVGVFTDVGLIHCYMDAGKVVEHSLTGRWIRRLSAVFSYPGLENQV